MNAMARFIKLGAQDADRRMAAALAPRSFAATDRYLLLSVVVRFADRLTRGIQELWSASVAGGTASAIHERWRQAGWLERYRALGLLLIVGAAVHIALAVTQGPRPGWFWLIVPALAAVFGAFLLLASQSTRTTH